jgi:hypothetical protein
VGGLLSTDPRKRTFSAAFTEAEVQAIYAFHESWLAVTEVVRKRQRKSSEGRHGTLSEVQAQPEWDDLRVAAHTALQRFDGL